MYKNFTDLVDFVGSRPKPFDDRKKYISTGALKTNNISEDDVEIIDYATRPSRANLEVKTGDILFAKMAFTDKRLFVGEIEANYIYSTGFYAVKPKDGILTTKCLYYLLSSQTFNNQKNANSSGATQKAITINGLKKLKLIVPEYNNQDRIGKILESVELIINNKKQQLSEYDQLIKSRFVEMFGDISINSKSFNIKPLSDLCFKIGDGLHGTPLYDDKGNYYFINGNNLGNDYIKITETTKKVNEEVFKKHYVQFGENTIFLSINGTLGNVALYNEEPIILGKSAAYCNLKPSLNIKFVAELFKSNKFKEYMLSNSSGTTITNFGLKAFRNYPMIVPPMILQTQFIKFLKQVEKLKFIVQQSLNETQQLFDSLMQEYFG